MRLARTALALVAVPAFLAVAASPAAASCASASATAASASDVQLTQATLCLVNRYRAERGLPALRTNRRLAAAARRHAQDMVRRRYFSHLTPEGTDFVKRIRRAGYGGRLIGENIAWGSGSLGSPAATVRSWMDSPPHRRNLLHRRFRQAGLGIVPGAPSPSGAAAATYTLTFGGR